MDDLKPCLLPCNLEQLNDRINNLSAGLTSMSSKDIMRVNKTFLTEVLNYMEELLGLRREEENRRAAPENKPLTLEELQGMARDLMSSCVVREAGKSDCIAIIDYDNISKFGPKNNIIAIVSAFGTPLLEKDYGKTWLAYAHKPEGSEP
jgi:hypothetical protein